MNYLTNAEVKTPVGRGVVQGRLVVQDGDGKRIAAGILVRVKLSGSQTDSRCMTPRAVKSSLWVFREDELCL